MKKSLGTRAAALAVAAFVLAVPLAAERGDDANRKSKNGLVSGSIDGVAVTIEYGRPNVKEREIWGALVPWGKVWRTGADEATTISFDADVSVEGQPLAAGTYALFTVPGEESWMVVFNSVADQWGTYGYDAAKDVLKVDVEPTAGEHTETLTFEVGSGEVVFRWEKIAVAFSVAAR